MKTGESGARARKEGSEVLPGLRSFFAKSAGIAGGLLAIGAIPAGTNTLAGVGYRLGKGFELPPLMFTTDEARALAMATRIAQQWLDPALALAAGDAMSRVLSVLPVATRTEVDRMPLFVPPVGLSPGVGDLLKRLREATLRRTVLVIEYLDASEQRSTRRIWPLGCFFWGKVWTLAAWCEHRQDFRSFRVDRIASLRVLEERFADEPGRTLADLLRREADCAVSAADGAPSGP